MPRSLQRWAPRRWVAVLSAACVGAGLAPGAAAALETDLRPGGICLGTADETPERLAEERGKIVDEVRAAAATLLAAGRCVVWAGPRHGPHIDATEVDRFNALLRELETANPGGFAAVDFDAFSRTDPALRADFERPESDGMHPGTVPGRAAVADLAVRAVGEDRGVDQRISLVTLGVDDLPRARAFYEALGWRGQEIEATVFFQAGDMALVLWGREELVRDAGVQELATRGFGGIVLAHNVRSDAEVDALVAAAEAAGARVTRPASATFYGGYAATFADPDGHVWEIACNPGLPLGDDGSLTLPGFGT